MRKINKIIIHCSATRPGLHIGAAEIRQWHIRDNGWSDIGYHGVIRRDGTLDSGRPLDQPGAHTNGHNKDSIGICLVGGIDDQGNPENNFIAAQWATLERVVADLVRKFPNARVAGHRDFASKACPCFDAAAWWEFVKGEKR